MSTDKVLTLYYQIVLPELALLRFGVVDDNDKLIAQRVVPLDGLQSGKVDHLIFLNCYRKFGIIYQIQGTVLDRKSVV